MIFRSIRSLINFALMLVQKESDRSVPGRITTEKHELSPVRSSRKNKTMHSNSTFTFARVSHSYQRHRRTRCLFCCHETSRVANERCEEIHSKLLEQERLARVKKYQQLFSHLFARSIRSFDQRELRSEVIISSTNVVSVDQWPHSFQWVQTKAEGMSTSSSQFRWREREHGKHLCINYRHHMISTHFFLFSIFLSVERARSFIRSSRQVLSRATRTEKDIHAIYTQLLPDRIVPSSYPTQTHAHETPYKL